MDLEEITTYRIIQNGVQGAPLAAADLTVTNNVYSVTDSVYGYTVTGLTPETEYVFKLEAGNGTGQWSVDGPVMTVLTLPEQIAEPIDTEDTDMACGQRVHSQRYFNESTAALLDACYR